MFMLCKNLGKPEFCVVCKLGANPKFVLRCSLERARGLCCLEAWSEAYVFAVCSLGLTRGLCCVEA